MQAGRRSRLARQPALWLFLLAALVFLLLAFSSELEPTPDPDTWTYLRAARAPSATLLLANIRTAGYPLLLRWLAPSEEAFGALPPLHAGVFFAAVFVFWAAVRLYSGSPWLAFAAAAPLVFSDLLGLVNRVRPDVVTAAAALIAVSALLGLARRPRSAPLWAALAAALFLTLQLRPSYLLLAPLVPPLGVALRLCATPVPLRRLRAWTVGLAAAALLPLLAFCAARWLAVGHFGLVSFGGFNLIGATASFLDDELVAELPPAQRELGRRILERRRRHGFEPYAAGDDARAWHRQYNTNVWKIALGALADQHGMSARQLEDWVEAGTLDPSLPAARRAWRPGGIDMNRQLAELAHAVIRLRPGLYARWVRDTTLLALDRSLLRREILWPAALLALSLAIAALLRRREGRGDPATPVRSSGRPAIGLALLAAAWFLALLVPTALVSIPFDRYLVATSLLVPSALFALLFETWRPFLERRSARPGVDGVLGAQG